jgi:type IX secretion system PorP/SprF family membrane protein
MKKLLRLSFSIALATNLQAQQDPQYNLYQFNQMIINPAYAGARDNLNVVAANRQQWVGFEGAPKTTCLSLHGPVLKKNLGLGLTVVNDIMGPRNVTSIYGNVAYLLKINSDSRLSFGLNAGYNRYQFNFDKIDWKTAEAPSQLFSNQTTGALDINGGLYYRTSSFFLGVSASHLNNPSVYTYQTSANNSISYRLRTHLFISAGYSYPLNDNILLAPTVLVKLVDGTFNADINVNFFVHKVFWVGAFYRMGFGPGLLTQYYVSKKLRVGLSYDTGLQAARRLGSSFEAMFGYDFGGGKSKMTNPRFL